MNERIEKHPEIIHGEIAIKGTRIPVKQIIGMLTNGDTVEELLQDYPSLEKYDIHACIDTIEDQALSRAIKEGSGSGRASQQDAMTIIMGRKLDE